MSRTSLREYIQEIENLIENGQNEEAIAHCKHILQEHPKNVATHRLLGKAHLELQQDQEAAAEFQQVLDAVPDDFIAHLGMSVIREHGGDLDASIRHMERAFDVQPANAIIQGELRRLYKERDGLEPQKIHLTRGALARMYAKGDLYTQAIAELRAALAEDPQRPDLQIVLAKMYASSGQLLEAAETCSSLLNKFPDCLEANILLGDILSRNDRAGEAQAHYQRAAAFDPYAAYISPGQPDPASVPDDTVMLETLEYEPGDGVAPPPVEGEWAEEIAAGPVGKDQQFEQAEESLPVEAAGEPGDLPVEPQPAGETPAEEIPDWMQTAGWEPATGEVEEAALDIEGEPEEFAGEEEELVKAEIPDWLKPLAPSEVEEISFPEAGEIERAVASETGPQDDLPEWLNELGEPAEGETGPVEQQAVFEETTQDLAVEGQGASVEETEPEPEAEMPDWLKAAQEEEAGQVAETPGWQEAADETEPEPEAERPDWLKAAQEEQTEPSGETPEWREAADETEPQPEAEAEMPDWLKAAQEEQVEPSVETPEWRKPEEAEPEAEMPDWLKAAQEEEARPVAETPGWQESADETEPEPEAEMPDWLKAAQEEQAEPVEPSGQAEWLPEEGIPQTEAGDGAAGEPEAEFPDWLRSIDDGLSAEQAFRAGEPPGEPTGETERPAGEPEVSEWLKSLGEESLAQEGETPDEEVEMPFLPEAEEPARAEAHSGVSEVPDWLRTALEEQEQSQVEQPADVPEWLRSSIPEGFPEEPPPIVGDTKPVRPRTYEDQPEEEPWESDLEEQVPGDIPGAEEMGELEEPEGTVPETTEETPAEVGWSELQEETYPTGDAGAPAGEIIEEEAAAMAWLESLAARQGVQEEELLTRPEDRPESIPEWLQKMAAESEAEPEVAAEPAVESEDLETDQPSWQPELEAEAEMPAEPVEAEAEFQPDQVEAGAAEPVEPAEEEIDFQAGPAEAEVEMPAEPVGAGEPDAQLPDWLRDFTEEDSGPSVEEAVSGGETVEPAAEPLDLNAATLAQLERIPGIGYIQAQNIVDYRDTHGPLTSREDLENVPGVSPDVIAKLEEWGAFERASVAASQVEVPQEVSLEIETDGQPPALAQAWGKLVEGEVSSAMDLYGDLIRKEQHLDQVIHELREAAFLYPQEISLHQALGDAYLRANRLQEALDAYNKAENLLK